MSKKKYEYPENLWDVVVQKMESLGLADNSYAAVRNIKFR